MLTRVFMILIVYGISLKIHVNIIVMCKCQDKIQFSPLMNSVYNFNLYLKGNCS
jgi:hypothetical protein